MAIRHILLVGLVSTASLAQAAPTTQTSSSIVAGWTLEKGSINVLGELDAVQIMLAQGNNANWNQHAQFANGKLQLFSLDAGTPVLAVSGGASNANQQAGAPGKAVGPKGTGPNNPNVLPNGVLTGGNSNPLSVPNSMKGDDIGFAPGGGASGHDGAGAGAGANAGAHDGAGAGALIDEAIKTGLPLAMALDVLDAPAAAIPEPATGALLLAGLMGSVLARRRRNK